MTYQTSTEKYFERLRHLMLKCGYDQSHMALQSLARLRRALREQGYTFEPVKEIRNG